jgi:hypothetical protein
MRKGFTLTLTTLVVALLATSVYAFGPTVGAVPDVWITEKTAAGAADGPQYMFRYSDAILLNDFVTPGVSTGDGSASDTLFWAMALRQSNGTAGYGAFMTGTGKHYSATGTDAVEVLAEEPTFSVSGSSFTPSTWVSEVNGWAGKSTLADSGSLTFRNIRLNGTVDATNASPTSDTTNAQLPVGYLDAQEATVFVTDGVTSPGFDTFNLITLISNTAHDRDSLSGGGPSYSMVEDYTSSTPTSAWTLLGVGVSVHLGTNAAGPTVSNNGTGLVSATFPTVNNKGSDATDPYFPTMIFFKDNLSVTTDKVYRLSARAGSSNTDKTKNPSISADLNGRTSVGEAQNEASYKPLLANISTSPVLGTPITLKTFLRPAANGIVKSWFVVWDTTDAVGGSVTLDQMKVQSFDPTLLTGGTTLGDFGTGATAFSGFITGTLAFYNPGANSVTGSCTASANTLSFTGSGTSSTNNDGAIYALHTAPLFTTSAGTVKKLVVVEVQAKTTSGDAAKIPDFVFAVNDFASAGQPGNARATFYIDRFFSGSTVQNPDADLAATARPYYAIFEANPATSYDISFFCCVFNADGTNGNVTVERITAKEYDLPTE